MLTRKQRDLLERHAEHFRVMASYVRECDRDELEALHEACEAVSSMNAWDLCKAAQFLLEEIDLQRRFNDMLHVTQKA